MSENETIEPKAWPYREADMIPDGRGARERPVLFETGFGPSGLPHLGTFAEVARTDWVRRAYEEKHGGPTELYAFSDDMDGMRGVPLGMPHPDALIEHLGKPLSEVPDPFGEHESFAHHMNAKLRAFLDSFGFAYTFKSSQECYRSGAFDDALRRVVDCYDAVRGAVTRTLSDEHAADWSPFKPICASCGRVTTTRVLEVDREQYSVRYACDQRMNAKLLSWEERARGELKRAAPEAAPYWIEKIRVEGCGHEGEAPVRGGACKVGWKVDWAMRWYAFGVDYEMYGKDLIDSAKVSGEIVKILGGVKPAGMAYEWFNDEHGGSISKTKGNGLSVEQWLRYGPTESLAWFVFQNPKKAKKLYFGTIPDSADRYLTDRTKFAGQSPLERRENPVWFVDWPGHGGSGEGVGYDAEITYSLLLNLVGVLNTDDRALVWEYVRRYDPDGGRGRAILN